MSSSTSGKERLRRGDQVVLAVALMPLRTGRGPACTPRAPGAGERRSRRGSRVNDGEPQLGPDMCTDLRRCCRETVGRVGVERRPSAFRTPTAHAGAARSRSRQGLPVWPRETRASGPARCQLALTAGATIRQAVKSRPTFREAPGSPTVGAVSVLVSFASVRQGAGKAVGSGDQAAPAYRSRSTNSNLPVVGAIGGAGFQAAFRYR